MIADYHEPVILIAEDNNYDVFMFCRLFRNLGANVPFHVVQDGEEAISYLEGTGKYSNHNEYPLPNLFLLDLKMPPCDGFDVLRWVRRQSWLSGLRIVVLTSSENLYDVKEAYRLGATSYLVKPHLPGDLQNHICALYEYWRVSKNTRISRARRPIGSGRSG